MLQRIFYLFAWYLGVFLLLCISPFPILQTALAYVACQYDFIWISDALVSVSSDVLRYLFYNFGFRYYFGFCLLPFV